MSLDEISDRWEAWGQQVGFPRTLSEEQTFFSGFWDQLGREFQLSSDILTQLHAFDYTTCLHPFADARPALRWARKAGLRVGVLSNFSLASLEDSLVATGLADLVDAACAATVIGVAKPAPESYLAVTRALGVEPEQCLFFDDELPCVDGARALGISAYLVDRTQATHRLSQGVVSDLSATGDNLRTRLMDG